MKNTLNDKVQIDNNSLGYLENNSANIKKKTKFEELKIHLDKHYKIRMNSVTMELEWKKKDSKEFEVMNINDLYFEFYRSGFSKFKEELNAIFGSSETAKFDPFEEYFNSLPSYNPNEEPDYINELTEFIKTDDQEWFKRIFKKFLVQMVGQSLGKIEFNKHCLTLVGKQHDGKTTFLDWLVPTKLKKYIKKGFEFRGNKESKFSLVQNFLINLDELASFEKKELNNEFKSVLSESIVKYCPKYSNQEIAFRRRASFVASTNQFEFLTDETGNVRWLVFKVLNIVHDNGKENGYTQKLDIDNIWKQAYYLLHSKDFDCVLSKDEISQQEILNNRFVKTTDEMEYIIRHFEKPTDETINQAKFFTASEIVKALESKGLRTNRNFVGRALTNLKYEISSKWNIDRKFTEKGYYIISKDF
jgi:hypothetical protein